MNKSFYILTFPDGSTVHSDESSWHSYSQKTKVLRDTAFKLVYASNVPIKSILMHHYGLEKSLDIPEGCRVFQSIVARTLFVGEKVVTEILGRSFGLVKNDRIIEEYNMSSETNMITGFKL